MDVIRPSTSSSSIITDGSLLSSAPQQQQQQQKQQQQQQHVFTLELNWNGGLNNIRGQMLQSLIYAKAWGIRTVTAGWACLKLPNIQMELPLSHRYTAPFDFVRLERYDLPFMGKRRPVGRFCPPDGFRFLFDWEYFVATIKEKFDIDVLPIVVKKKQNVNSNNNKSKSNNNNKNNNKNNDQNTLRISDELSSSWTWDRLLNLSLEEEFQKKTVAAAAAAEGEGGGAVEGRSSSNLVSVTFARQDRLLWHMYDCFTLANCMALDGAFRPSRQIVNLFVKPILSSLSLGADSDFCVVHFRKFNCYGAAESANIPLRIHTFLLQLVQRQELPDMPKTLYIASGFPYEKFAPLEEMGNFRVVTKDRVNRNFTTYHYPFEVMAMVDYAVASEATDVVSLTGHRGSSWGSFLDFGRARAKKRRRVLWTKKDCFGEQFGGPGRREGGGRGGKSFSKEKRKGTPRKVPADAVG